METAEESVQMTMSVPAVLQFKKSNMPDVVRILAGMETLSY